MYLKAIEIQGFKSFADKTTITFEKDITAIVGPNGSGKSNISDAMLWVMGEQRSKTLRGGKMEDVIFGGTEKRSPLGFAQVSLILDNSGGTFDVDAPELTISRRYYRNGESEYYLNRESVRLRDITGLLMDTGLGRDGYSVIGQGRIAEIVSAKSSDRREIFEEAAGIARYRYRKEEAERKLARTDDNLLRINDKIDELEMQVTPLKKQAETAKKFLILRDEQRELEINVWMENLDKLHAQCERAEKDLAEAKAELAKAERELDELYAVNDNLSAKMRECDMETERERERLSAAESSAAECESAIAVLNNNLKHNDESIERLKSELGEQAERAEGIRAQAEAHRGRVADIDSELVEKSLAIRAAERDAEAKAAECDESRQGLSRLIAAENEANEALAAHRATIAQLADRAAELNERGTTIAADIEEAEERYDEVSKRYHEAQREADKARERYNEVNNIINGHRMLMGGREKKVQELTEKLNNISVEKRAAEGRIKMLSEMEQEYEGFGKAVKNVMRAAERGTLRGIHGPISGLISVPDKYAIAVETALGGAMQNIVVDSQRDGSSAIDMLKRSDGGRGTFVPIDVTKGFSLSRVPSKEEGFVGVASELVKCDEKYREIVAHYIGRTVVAETLRDAMAISRKNGNSLRIVTLDGQMINAGGSMTGGSAAKNVGILSRANELQKLKAALVKMVEEEAKASEELENASRELEKARYELQVASAEQDGAADEYRRSESGAAQLKMMQTALDESIESLETERAGLSGRRKENEQKISDEKASLAETEKRLEALKAEISAMTAGHEDFESQREIIAAKISAIREELASLQTERETTIRSAESLEEVIAAISGDSDSRRAGIEDILRRSEDIKAELAAKGESLAAHRLEADAHRGRISELGAMKMELEGKRTRSEKAAQERNRDIIDIQGRCNHFESKRSAAEMEEKQILDKLWDSYELSRSAAQQLRKSVEDMPAASKRITELRREISRLGNVNLGAIEEYERVSERYDFLSSQRDDVEKAKRELQKIIADITGEMKDIFLREFAAIDEKFRTVFLELFGGGKAALELEDPEDPLGCGIGIKVQPPGKAVTNISLLSGGEKSFVAIALYFAIMKVRPTPFCIMDEIDAALDEANVARYADYMRSMTDKTQFIVITHHRATMEEADVLYGVTMQEKGVTTVLSVDLEEAEKTIAS